LADGELEAPVVFADGAGESEFEFADGREGFDDAFAMSFEGLLFVGSEQVNLAGEAVPIGVETGAVGAWRG
jgi:hypothetical protein